MHRETKATLAILAVFVLLIGGMVGYNALATQRERPVALVVNVTARQRALVERYIKDTILTIDGVQADPSRSAKILTETADALLDGGDVVTPQGSLDQRVRIPGATSSLVREKLRHERTLIRQLLAAGAALRAGGKSSPTYAADLRRLRVRGAELSSVTGDAAGEITKEGQRALSRLVWVEIVLGVMSAIAAVTMALLLRRSGQRRSARFRSLVHNSTDLITVLDQQAVALYQSPSSERVLGYPAAEILGSKLSELLHPSDKKQVIEAFAAALQRPGEAVDLHFRLRHRDGHWVRMEATATNLLDDRSVRGFVVNSRDVTERERAAAELAAARDEALSASVTKSQFLASMSHEIRTPMNAIIGLTELLLDTSLVREQREYARGVQGAAEGLLGIINDILDFSKVEAGKLEIEAVPFDLGEVVEDVASLLGEVANGKGIELLAHCPPEVPRALIGDPTRLRQILVNLTSNAVKFTAAGEVVVRVRLLEDAPEAVRVRVEVSDTGVGIAGSDLERLFDPFAQADSSTTRRFGGTGLGLAIVKQLVELMHGNVGVESAVDVGSTFWFEIPLPKQEGTIRERPLVHELRDLRTLIVDDNATNRLILREQLGSWGMRTNEAEHAFRALELMRAAAAAGAPYEVVVLDLNMPDMDGLELAHAIAEDPGIAGPSLFMLSSSGRVSHDVAETAGLSGTLAKPARQSELYNCLISGLSASAGSEACEPAPSAAAISTRQGRVLLVEDNAMNQLVATRLLGKLGYDVEIASNGFEALEALERAEYHAVLMDCQMPEMDGYAATRELRSREGDLRRTPVIAMTAAAMQGDREQCLAAGMDDYVTKPIRPDALVAALDRWIVLEVPPESDAESESVPGSVAQPEPAPAEAESEPAASSGDAAELDAARLAMLRDLDDGDGGLLAMIAVEFTAEASRQLGVLREAVAEGDPQAVERAAHSIKGSSANLGAGRLCELSARLEGFGRARALDHAAALVDEIAEELERVRIALDLVVPAR